MSYSSSKDHNRPVFFPSSLLGRSLYTSKDWVLRLSVSVYASGILRMEKFDDMSYDKFCYGLVKFYVYRDCRFLPPRGIERNWSFV